ncbi:MAG: hypothetical protein ACRDRJ_00660 [Streptosporangiaceae bacterium]
MRWKSRDGRWRVDLIRLSGTADHRDGDRFRIARDGYFLAEARTVEELSRHVDPAELEEALAVRNLYGVIRGSRKIANRYARPVIRWSIWASVADGPIAQISLAPCIDSQGFARLTLIRSPSTR